MANNTPATTATASDTTSSTSDIDPCLLKRLPAELRTTIFEYAIAEDKPIAISFESTHRKQHTPVLRDLATYIDITGFQLAQTCRQFRAEVLPLLCTVNTIALELPIGKQLTGTAIPAFVNKTPHLTIYIEDREHACKHDSHIFFDAGKIHIKQDAGRIIEVSGSGSLRDRCLCELEEIAARCEGKDCMRDFVDGFEEKRLRILLSHSRRSTKKGKLVCEKCGKAETPVPFWF